MSEEDSMVTTRGDSLKKEEVSMEDSMPLLVPAAKEDLCKTELAKEQRKLWLLQRESVILSNAIVKNKFFLAKMKKEKKAQEQQRRLKDANMHGILVAGGAPDGYGEDSVIVSYF